MPLCSKARTGIVHGIVKRVAVAIGRNFGRPARAALAAAVVIDCLFAADRFGLVALIARGYRVLAVVILVIDVLPLLTIGVMRPLSQPEIAA